MEKQGILVKGGKYVKFMDFGKQEIQEKEGLQKKIEYMEDKENSAGEKA